jgi:acetyltransferase-like isoleucine patch superfamily enzyme
MTEQDAEEFHRHDLDFSPWSFWRVADEEARGRQLELQQSLVEQDGYELGEQCFVSGLASVANDELRLGDRSYVAAGAYLSGSLSAGADCTINPYAVVRGLVRLGDGVRIGAHTSVLGFNHTFGDPDVEVFRQPVLSVGITIGNDVWVGSHAVVLDGVTVGDRSVIAAGAIVTKDVPAGAVAGGNPARVLRWRVPPVAPPDDLHDRLATWSARLPEAAERLLDRGWDAERRLFHNLPGAGPTVRAQCDAVEIADLLLRRAPDQVPAAEQIERLRGWQDQETGMVAELGADGSQERSTADLAEIDGYHILSVGYALDLLGSQFPEPVHAVARMDAKELVRGLENRPWQRQAWAAGAWVDHLGTALLWNHRAGVEGEAGLETLVGWLMTHADRSTGMWGGRTPEDGLLQVVNGFYRASRGTFAQFGLPLPDPDRVVDTVLEHVRDARFFRPERQNACNVLDVAHPLWFTRASGYRAEEVISVAQRLLTDALGHWRKDAGFGFAAGQAPSLQGTEMWLSVIWLLSDIVGRSDALGYRPRGVHRPEPALLVRP